MKDGRMIIPEREHWLFQEERDSVDTIIVEIRKEDASVPGATRRLKGLRGNTVTLRYAIKRCALTGRTLETSVSDRNRRMR